MELSAEQFVDQLLTKEALETPSDDVKPEELTLELPKWFDEKKFNQGRHFYWEFCQSFSTTMLLGLVSVFAVPSILQVLVGSRRSSSIYTAYRRYLSTLLHTVSWFQHELKPGSISWKSLYTVRSRHLRATIASKLKGGNMVSQRDVALTQFGFVGFAILKPDQFGIRQLKEDDWEGYNHFWRVVGHMIGLEDRYNICRENIDKTRQVCQLLLDRVYTPCLENVPEYFEHMARVMIDGLWVVNPIVETESLIYYTRYLADVPGYIYTEKDRIDFQRRLKEQLKGDSIDRGVDSRSLMCKPAVDGLPERPPRLLFYRDFDALETSPEYKRLNFHARFKLSFAEIAMKFYDTYLGRWYFNLNYMFSLFLMKYFPYLAFIKYGIRASFVNIFEEDPTDNTKPKVNAEYYKKTKASWYTSWLSMFW